MSGGQQDFVAIAIAAQAGEQFVGPCGACRSQSFLRLNTLSLSSIICLLFRQFMAEFNPDIPIYLVRPDLEVQVCPSTITHRWWATNLNVDMSANISKDQHAFRKLINGVQYFSTQVTNLNVLLPEAFTPRVGKVISKLFQKPLIWYIYRGWISNSTATEPTELMEPVEPTELCEKMLKF